LTQIKQERELLSRYNSVRAERFRLPRLAGGPTGAELERRIG
jgi:hypothetical protein